jgi:hypothetical protein
VIGSTFAKLQAFVFQGFLTADERRLAVISTTFSAIRCTFSDELKPCRKMAKVMD